ncbi:MAG: hypothetical protein ACK5QC_10280 [Bacteroidota bacterium]|jgi:hypothetical protein|nr:hypothetical protein [Bacteroidota bacterium]MCA6442380.1 hypothetical protein [Bacteroidota bacterium]
MTTRKILNVTRKIEALRSNNAQLEALILSYHLNYNLLKFLYNKLKVNRPDNSKLKLIITDIESQLEQNPELKRILSKKNFKVAKFTLVKTESILKALKSKLPANTSKLLLENINANHLLSISVNKAIRS